MSSVFGSAMSVRNMCCVIVMRTAPFCSACARECVYLNWKGAAKCESISVPCMRAWAAETVT